jgi:hypothetical protein
MSHTKIKSVGLFGCAVLCLAPLATGGCTHRHSRPALPHDPAAGREDAIVDSLLKGQKISVADADWLLSITDAHPNAFAGSSQVQRLYMIGRAFGAGSRSQFPPERLDRIYNVGVRIASNADHYPDQGYELAGIYTLEAVDDPRAIPVLEQCAKDKTLALWANEGIADIKARRKG